MIHDVPKYQFDIIFLGGGIASVWLHRLALQLGYQSLLLSDNPIGHGQTIHAQGIIHGGTKYSLKGKMTESALRIKTMPNRWRACLAGKPHENGSVNTNLDLRGVRLLSEHHYLWTTTSWRSKMTAMLAGSALQAKATQVQQPNYPFAKEHNSLHQLSEFVIDVPHLLTHLLDPVSMRHAPITPNMVQENEQGVTLTLADATIGASLLVCAAGEGNQALLNALGSDIKTQIRPLRMLAMHDTNLPPVFAHAVEIDSVPRLTITTHTNHRGEPVWYLGGKLAEQGVDMSAEQLIEKAKSEIAALLPAFRFNNPRWRDIAINRAELAQRGHMRPEGASCEQVSKHTLAVWPTKLTCVPQLGDMFARFLHGHLKPTVPVGQYQQLDLAMQQIAQSDYYWLDSNQ